jgi:hypothetical protein
MISPAAGGFNPVPRKTAHRRLHRLIRRDGAGGSKNKKKKIPVVKKPIWLIK